MKDTFYFSHDYHARSDEKMIKLRAKMGWDGYGLYWAIVEKLYEAGGEIVKDYEILAYDMRTQCERITELLENYNLFYFTNKNTIRSRAVDIRLELRNDKKQKAKLSAEVRWKNAKAMRTHCESNAIKERKGKERKGKSKEDKPKDKSLARLGTGNLLIKMPLIGNDEIEIGDSFLKNWKVAYPKVNIYNCLIKMKNWLIANPKRRKTKAGILKFIVTWLAKEQDRPTAVELSAAAKDFGLYYLSKYEKFNGDGERKAAWLDQNKYKLNGLFKIAGKLQVAKNALDIIAANKARLGYRWTICDKSVSAAWPEAIVEAENKLAGINLKEEKYHG